MNLAEFLADQARHYEELLAQAVREIEAFDAPEAVRRAQIEVVREFLAADLRRCEREMTALFARGGRWNEPLH